MVYNVSGVVTNSTTVEGFFQGVNSMTSGGFGLMILIGLSVVAFTSFYFKTNDVHKTIIASTFVSFIIALFLKMLGLINGLALYVTLVFAGISLAFSFKSR